MGDCQRPSNSLEEEGNHKGWVRPAVKFPSKMAVLTDDTQEILGICLIVVMVFQLYERKQTQAVLYVLERLTDIFMDEMV